ncbi:hypothetical protein [Flavobacterium xinjiangense]|nr:hypothetical protein [Flavobacterium xinjiangense]
MGCLSAVILMSSCTTDSIGDAEKETSSKYTKLSVSATDEVIPPPIDDRDKTKG